ncbi:MAG: DUF1415 family protein [Polyangiales bacterium]
MGDERRKETAIRLFRKYVDAFVEPYGICPWSAPARRGGHVREVVLLDRTPAMSPTLAAIEALATDPEIEIGILIFPRVELDRPTWARFVADVRTADSEKRDRAVPFAMAEFHPEAPPVLAPSGAFVSFLRRTPDPTIQLVRRTALDRVRGDEDHGSAYFDPAMIEQLLEKQLVAKKPRLHDRVESHNRRAVSEAGLAKIATLLDALKHERDATYAALEADEATAAQ